MPEIIPTLKISLGVLKVKPPKKVITKSLFTQLRDARLMRSEIPDAWRKRYA